MSFHVGQKVEYIGPKSSALERYVKSLSLSSPKHRVPYTVSNVYLDGIGDEAIEILEIPLPSTSRYGAGFRARWFRPIVERKTDISIFTKMLNKNKELT